MGESRHPLGVHVGHLLFVRAQGAEYVQMLKGYASAASLVTVAAKFLGFSNAATGWILALGVLLIESVGLLIGWYHVKWGAAEEQQRRAIAQNPWQTETLERLRSIDERLNTLDLERTFDG